MSGKRLLDAAAMFRASRGVASKYVALQRHQLDIYSKTSSLVKGVKNQTIRVASTIRAASAVSQPLGHSSGENARRQGAPDSRQGTVNEKRRQKEQVSDSEQDQGNATAQPHSDSELSVQQANPKIHPLPDGSTPSVEPGSDLSTRDEDTFSGFSKTESGQKTPVNKNKDGLRPASSNLTSRLDSQARTELQNSHRARELQRDAEKQIPSVSAEPPDAEPSAPRSTPQNQDFFYTPSQKASRVLSSLPRVKLPKATGNMQQGDSHVSDEGINPDVFYSATSKDQQQQIPKVQAVPEQEQPSDAMYSKIFHSPRVAKLLKGESKKGKPTQGLELRGVQDTPVEQGTLMQEKDQESFNIRPTRQAHSKSEDSAKMSKPSDISKKADSGEVDKLAEDMAKDVASGSSADSEVSTEIYLIHEIFADKLTATR